jgi:threonylcarbamoyladenosine tRNA methylthiotransferase MtaB
MGQQVPNKIKQARSRILIELGQRMARAYGERFIGGRLAVLVERAKTPGLWEGHTPNYLTVRFQSPPGDFKDYAGQVADVEIRSWTRDGLLGEIKKIGS